MHPRRYEDIVEIQKMHNLPNFRLSRIISSTRGSSDFTLFAKMLKILNKIFFYSENFWESKKKRFELGF